MKPLKLVTIISGQLASSSGWLCGTWDPDSVVWDPNSDIWHLDTGLWYQDTGAFGIQIPAMTAIAIRKKSSRYLIGSVLPSALLCRYFKMVGWEYCRGPKGPISYKTPEWISICSEKKGGGWSGPDQTVIRGGVALSPERGRWRRYNLSHTT